MRFDVLRAAVFVALSVPSLAADPAAVSVLTLGLHHGDEVEAKSGERWMALVPDGTGHVLRECKLDVKTVNDPIVDDEGEATGKEVVTSDLHDEAIVLLRPVRPSKLAAGPVATWHAGETELAPSRAVSVGASGATAATLQLLRNETEDCRVVLTSGPRVQVLDASFNCLYVEEGPRGKTVRESDEKPRVLWSGDMDGDGRVDLLLQLSDHYNMSRVCLFLSTLAREGEIVALAGEHVTVGC